MTHFTHSYMSTANLGEMDLVMGKMEVFEGELGETDMELGKVEWTCIPMIEIHVIVAEIELVRGEEDIQLKLRLHFIPDRALIII